MWKRRHTHRSKVDFVWTQQIQPRENPLLTENGQLVKHRRNIPSKFFAFLSLLLRSGASWNIEWSNPLDFWCRICKKFNEGSGPWKLAGGSCVTVSNGSLEKLGTKVKVTLCTRDGRVTQNNSSQSALKTCCLFIWILAIFWRFSEVFFTIKWRCTTRMIV